MSTLKKINPLPFYTEWSGHPLIDLATLLSTIRAQRPNSPIIYLAGDSSLDNKAWVPSTGAGGEPLPVAIPDIYDALFDPPKPKPDVAFWLNHYLGSRATVVNAAVEATLLREREKALLPHDEFIRDHIRKEDVLIVSIGANDIALSPTTATIRHMLQLAWVTSRKSIEQGSASSLAYFRNMFGSQIQTYVSRLVEKQKPRAVIVCGIYYPLEASASTQTSWADSQLKMLGYGKYPSQLQAAIKQIYESAISQIEIEGTVVVPCALFEVMDGKNEKDYVARVEPSVEGGRKVAELLRRKVEGVMPEGRRENSRKVYKIDSQPKVKITSEPKAKVTSEPKVKVISEPKVTVTGKPDVKAVRSDGSEQHGRTRRKRRGEAKADGLTLGKEMEEKAKARGILLWNKPLQETKPYFSVV